mgnify:CR=1 FL=1
MLVTGKNQVRFQSVDLFKHRFPLVQEPGRGDCRFMQRNDNPQPIPPRLLDPRLQPGSRVVPRVRIQDGEQHVADNLGAIMLKDLPAHPGAELIDHVAASYILQGVLDRLRNLNLPDPGKSASVMDCHRRIAAAIRARYPAYF